VGGLASSSSNHDYLLRSSGPNLTGHRHCGFHFQRALSGLPLTGGITLGNMRTEKLDCGTHDASIFHSSREIPLLIITYAVDIQLWSQTKWG
jgi:hypothetical protein